MILGLLGLFIQLFSEASWIDYYSKGVKAFKIADQTIFFVAVALIVQALGIFTMLHFVNIRMDKLEIVSSTYIYRTSKTALEEAQSLNWFQRQWITWKYNRMMKMKILRRFYLKTYKMPELFHFSWYLRLHQDSQIQYLIEVEMSTWMLLLATWAVFCAIYNGFEIAVSQEEDDEEPRYVRVYVYIVFEILLSLSMCALLAYLNWCLRVIWKAEGCETNAKLLLKMERVAIEVIMLIMSPSMYYMIDMILL